jgi:phosphatidylserine/phosphatidylglycerophosphate/cardiolipin synthase-like enzyme
MEHRHAQTTLIAQLLLYQVALSNARQYVYFENQYFRYKEFAQLMRSVRSKLKQNGWKRDFYIFVVTNVPPGAGRMNTYDMLAALGKANSMPAIHKKEGEGEKSLEAALRKADLDGVHIHIATLATCAHIDNEMRYKEIYVHSKLLLIDDVFFTLGSANVNVRSMENDSELNIACPSPELTKQFREHLRKLDTKRS